MEQTIVNRDALHVEARELRREMGGISPKTETYKKLYKRLVEIEKLLWQV